MRPADDATPSGEFAGREEPYVDTGVGEEDALTRLWAPFRSHYVTRQPSSKGGASDPFVEAPRKSDEDALIVARGGAVYSLLNLYPYNSGHLMVVPYRKVADLEDLTGAETAELMEFAKKAVRVLKRVSRPEAINVGFNLGRSSGGSVGDHLHMHIVPRWRGDANFMTVLDGTKVLPTLLSETRQLLAEGWAELDREDRGNCGDRGDRDGAPGA